MAVKTALALPRFAPLCGWRSRAIHYPSVVPSPTSRVAAALAAWSTTLLLSSCSSSSSDGHPNSSRTEDKPVITGEPAGYNRADIAFADNMIANEKQGTYLSGLVPDRSDNSELVTFAAKSGAALKVDTQVLTALRAQWKEGQDNQTGGAKPPVAIQSPIDDATIAQLDSMHGAEFDTLWIKSTIRIDQGAIEACNTEIANGKNVDAVGLAKQVVKARQDDIGQMQRMLAD